MRYIPLLIMFFCFFSFPSQAHEGRPVYIEVTELTQGQMQLRWKIPPVLPSGAEPLIRLSGAECQISAGTMQASLTGTQLYQCSGDTADMQVDLKYKGANPVLSTLVMLQRDNGHTQSIMKGPDKFSIPLPAKETFFSVAKQYTLAGADHILEGYDHLLFVLCLMMLAGSLKRVLITVTGFTLGHSVTLGMSALAQWSLPPEFIEPLIALSILMLAVEITRGNKTTLMYRYPLLIATGFGLLHGFGFGGALAEIGLPYSLRIQALGFFNLGVEIGQIIFVIIAFLLFTLLKPLIARASSKLPLFNMSYLVLYPAGVIAAYWTIERFSSVL